MGSNKVHIYSLSVPDHNHRSAQPQFEEIESGSAQMLSFVLQCMESRCKAYFNHLKQGPPKKNLYQLKWMLYRENSHRFTSPSDRPFFWHYIFSTVEPPYPYALAQQVICVRQNTVQSPVAGWEFYASNSVCFHSKRNVTISDTDSRTSVSLCISATGPLR